MSKHSRERDNADSSVFALREIKQSIFIYISNSQCKNSPKFDYKSVVEHFFLKIYVFLTFLLDKYFGMTYNLINIRQSAVRCIAV
ncbi:MAG: hypothetical protein CR988_02105 [Treponema sp.]|nr:MAG: hypothetical protein CR988_02105 [Treponema sp.]